MLLKDTDFLILRSEHEWSVLGCDSELRRSLVSSGTLPMVMGLWFGELDFLRPRGGLTIPRGGRVGGFGHTAVVGGVLVGEAVASDTGITSRGIVRVGGITITFRWQHPSLQFLFSAPTDRDLDRGLSAVPLVTLRIRFAHKLLALPLLYPDCWGHAVAGCCCERMSCCCSGSGRMRLWQ